MENFNIIKYVTSGLSLIALLILVVFKVSKWLIDRKKNLIGLAEQKDRCKLIDRVLSNGDAKIDVSSLTNKEKKDIAILQIKSRTQIYSIGIKTFKFSLLIFFILTAYTISNQNGKVIENVNVIGKIVNIKNEPIYGASITIEGYDFFQKSRSTGLFEGRLADKISKGSYIIINVSLRGYLPESLNVKVESSTVQLHTIVLRKL